ncbi:MAG TPA: hypothetical protein VFX16_21065 [Pseudonocardiaceae bacterium]|nr:hypothetical protein [Pseudonocardiaceae bacterium]
MSTGPQRYEHGQARAEEDRPRLAGYRQAEERATCGQQDRNDQMCGKPAAMHLWLVDSDGDASALACDRHLPVARRAGLLVMEHRVTATCEMPGTAWDRDANVCIVYDGDGDVVDECVVDDRDAVGA